MNNAMASNLLNDSLQGLLVIFFEIIFNVYASFRQKTSSRRFIDIVFRSQKRLKLLLWAFLSISLQRNLFEVTDCLHHKENPTSKQIQILQIFTIRICW